MNQVQTTKPSRYQWILSDDELLYKLYLTHRKRDKLWGVIATEFNIRKKTHVTSAQCKTRWERYFNSDSLTSPLSDKQLATLNELYTQYQENWSLISRTLGKDENILRWTWDVLLCDKKYKIIHQVTHYIEHSDVKSDMQTAKRDLDVKKDYNTRAVKKHKKDVNVDIGTSNAVSSIDIANDTIQKVNNIKEHIKNLRITIPDEENKTILSILQEMNNGTKQTHDEPKQTHLLVVNNDNGPLNHHNGPLNHNNGPLTHNTPTINSIETKFIANEWMESADNINAQYYNTLFNQMFAKQNAVSNDLSDEPIDMKMNIDQSSEQCDWINEYEYQSYDSPHVSIYTYDFEQNIFEY